MFYDLSIHYRMVCSISAGVCGLSAHDPDVQAMMMGM